MPKRKTPHKPLVQIESRIRTVRGHKVILDSDLAEVYAVTTKALNQAVRRNLERFPEDFVFQLQKNEFDSLALQNATVNLRSQIVTSRFQHGGRRKLPYAFTEHGAIMAANVLKSKRAVQMSVFVVRAFVRLREVAITQRELAEKLKELELRVGNHDTDISAIIDAIRQLMTPPDPPKRRLGFEVKEPKVRYGTR